MGLTLWTTTYLIGGGPSAGDVDTAVLAGGVRVGLNEAAFRKPCDAFFSNDLPWVLENLPRIRALNCERHIALWPRCEPGFAAYRQWFTIWHRVYTDAPLLLARKLASGLPDTPACTGVVAMNLAAQMGARRIVLIGYDMHESYEYFWGGGEARRDVPGVLRHFRAVAPWYAERGIEVLNASRNSAVDAFQRVDL